MSDFINIINEEPADDTAEIKGAKINNVNYKFDYNYLKHAPAYLRLTEKAIVLAETTITVEDGQPTVS